MKRFFEEQKRNITILLQDALKKETKERKPDRSVGIISADVRKKLLEFSLRGKMLRGGLVRLGYELFRSDNNKAVTACGAALELFQSALLIHDDIMDHDDVRRGVKTLHTLYAEKAQAAGLKDPVHTGLSLGICVGDVGFFLGFHILADLPPGSVPHQEVISLFAREMCLVGAAQMLDVSAVTADPGHTHSGEEDILTLYRYKTGRYTFSLPLSLGALLAGQKGAVRSALESLGEKLGIIFQIKDDELGLFSGSEQIGKPSGTDIREGKRTIYFTRLVQKLNAAETKRFLSFEGQATLTASDIDFARQLIRKYNVADEVADTVKHMTAACHKDIEGLVQDFGLPPEPLTGLLEYGLVRSH